MRPWAEHLTSLPKMEVDALSSGPLLKLNDGYLYCMCEFCINHKSFPHGELYKGRIYAKVINDVEHTQTVHLQIVMKFIVNY